MQGRDWRADDTTQGHWDGQIDEVRVIGDALSQAEVQALMESYDDDQRALYGAEGR